MFEASDRTSASIPKPALVPYNDWRRVALPAPEAFTPTLPVSVIVPCYQPPAATLEMTFATLERQTYPRDLFEVVLVDDGSASPLAPPPSPLDVTVVRQQRHGVGIARARNTGVRAAAHGILLFLDADMLVEADWIAAHARWHHAVSDVLTLGGRAYVAMDGMDANTIRHRPDTLRSLLSGRPMDPPEVAGHLTRTGNLTTRADDPFRVVIGGNFGIGKDFYWLIGGSDESFTRHCLEEVELGYRAYTHGALLAPVQDAFAWHQGRIDAKERSLRIQRAKIAHLIAHRGLRGNWPGRIFSVPQHVVSIATRDASADRIIEMIFAVLADREHDLVVRIEAASMDGDERALLRETFEPDPRVHLGGERSALAEFPVVPFHIALPSTCAFAPNLVSRLRTALGDAVTAYATLSDNSRASITRTWALHRAHRTMGSPADFGEAHAVSAAALKMRCRSKSRSRHIAEPTGYPSKPERLFDRARDIRNMREAWAFSQWLAVWSGRWLAQRWRKFLSE